MQDKGLSIDAGHDLARTVRIIGVFSGVERTSACPSAGGPLCPQPQARRRIRLRCRCERNASVSGFDHRAAIDNIRDLIVRTKVALTGRVLATAH